MCRNNIDACASRFIFLTDRFTSYSFCHLRPSIPGGVFGAGSSFCVGWRAAGCVCVGGGGGGDGDLFPFSRSFVAVLANFSFWGGEWAQSYNSMKFLIFPSFLRS